MDKQDFLKFYMENKDKRGYISFGDIRNNFEVRSGHGTKYEFEDENGIKFVKSISRISEINAEMIFPRIYKKLGFRTAKYYPVQEGNYSKIYAVTPKIDDKDTHPAICFQLPFFRKNGCIFPSKNELLTGEDVLAPYFAPSVIKDMLVMRLLDTASFNCDRHKENFFYHINRQDAPYKFIDEITTIDYGSSAYVSSRDNFGRYHNNFSRYGDENLYRGGLTRGGMLWHYKENETVQAFLPSQESAEMLGSVDFDKEAKDVAEETGYQVERYLLNAWAKSFDDMAEELAQN